MLCWDGASAVNKQRPTKTVKKQEPSIIKILLFATARPESFKLAITIKRIKMNSQNEDLANLLAYLQRCEGMFVPR